MDCILQWLDRRLVLHNAMTQGFFPVVAGAANSGFFGGFGVFTGGGRGWHGNGERGGDVLIAVPICQGRVSPVFDVATRLLVVRLKGGVEVERREVALFEDQPAGIVRTLEELGVGTLVCGAISNLLERLLTAAGVRVVPRICGDIEAVLRACRNGKLDAPELQMPGCCGRRWAAGDGGTLCERKGRKRRGLRTRGWRQPGMSNAARAQT